MWPRMTPVWVVYASCKSPVWFLNDPDMVLIWPLHDSYLTRTCPIFDSHMTLIWPLYYMTFACPVHFSICLSYSTPIWPYMTPTWHLYSPSVIPTWPLYDPNTIPIRIYMNFIRTQAIIRDIISVAIAILVAIVIMPPNDRFAWWSLYSPYMHALWPVSHHYMPR